MGMGAYGIAGGMSQIALFTGIYLVICLGSIACWAYAGSRLQGAGLSSPIALVQSGHGALAAAQRRLSGALVLRGELRSVLARVAATRRLELALEVGLIGKTAGSRPLPPGLPLAQQGAGVANALIEQVGVGPHAVVAAEGAHEVGRGEPGHRAQLCQGEGAGTVVLHQLGGSLQVLGRAVIPLGRVSLARSWRLKRWQATSRARGSGSATSCR